MRRERLACRIVGRIGLARGFLFEAIEQAVQIQPVEHHARTLAHGHQLRPPHFVKGAALDAHVFHRLLVGKAAFEHHGLLLDGNG